MFKKTALVILFAALSSALAVSSTQTDYDNASLSLTAQGTYAEAVSFSVPSTELTLSAEQIRPGNSFTVSIPVTNTTDRTIKLTATAGAPSGTGAAQLTVAPVNAEASVPAGQTTTLTFTLAFSSSMDAAQAGQTVAVVFDVAATAGDDNTSAEGSSF